MFQKLATKKIRIQQINLTKQKEHMTSRYMTNLHMENLHIMLLTISKKILQHTLLLQQVRKENQILNKHQQQILKKKQFLQEAIRKRLNKVQKQMEIKQNKNLLNILKKNNNKKLLKSLRPQKLQKLQAKKTMLNPINKKPNLPLQLRTLNKQHDLNCDK